MDTILTVMIEPRAYPGLFRVNEIIAKFPVQDVSERFLRLLETEVLKISPNLSSIHIVDFRSAP